MCDRNYKMKLSEGSLEFQLTFNRLRERTHVLLNLWGGIGITSFKTKSDLLDANGNQRHWILELQFIDEEEQIGGYFEQLLC